MLIKNITILERIYAVAGDEDYLGTMTNSFELNTCALLAALCNSNTIAVDVGANLGLTALALAQIAPQGRVIAFEPVPAAYSLLERNVRDNQVANISCVNCALGAEAGFAEMFVNHRNYATSFITATSSQQQVGQVPLRRLDDCIAQTGTERIDFIKIDVEGFELDVLAGASQLLARDKPTVLLEMNHWCLNVFRRISIPEFHERLLAIFPALFVVQDTEVVDFRDLAQAGRVFHEHVIGNRFMHVVGGFNRAELIKKLARLHDVMPVSATAASEEMREQPASIMPLRQRLRRSLRILRGKET